MAAAAHPDRAARLAATDNDPAFDLGAVLARHVAAATLVEAGL